MACLSCGRLSSTSVYPTFGRVIPSNEQLAHVYHGLYGIRVTGLRFFTVYGPWGRPDMAYFSFTRKIARGEPIEVYGEGRMARDFTYIDDIIAGVLAVIDRPPADDGAVKPGGDLDVPSTLAAAVKASALAESGGFSTSPSNGAN